MTHIATSIQRGAGVGALPINLAVRMIVVAVLLAVLAVAALVVMAPAKVTIPLATVLVLGFAVGSVVALIDRHRSRVRVGRRAASRNHAIKGVLR